MDIDEDPRGVSNPYGKQDCGVRLAKNRQVDEPGRLVARGVAKLARAIEMNPRPLASEDCSCGRVESGICSPMLGDVLFVLAPIVCPVIFDFILR